MRIVFMGTPAFAADILQGSSSHIMRLLGVLPGLMLFEAEGKNWFILRLRSEPFKLGFPYMNSRL